MKTLETPRTRLRPFSLKDVQASYQMNCHPDVVRFTGDGGIQSIDEIRRRIQDDVMGDYRRYGYGRHAVELKATGQFIGFCGLKYLPEYDQTDLGYRFVPDCWGRGLATETARAALEFGFEDLQLNSIIGLVIPDNVASVRVLDKLGMQFHDWLDDDGIRVARYQLTRTQWLVSRD